MGKDHIRSEQWERPSVSGDPSDALREGNEYVPAVHVQGLIEELRLRQIELETRSNELSCVQGELKAAREKYAALYASAPVGYVTLDMDGTIISVNSTGANLLGLETWQCMGKTFSRFVAGSCREIYISHHRQALETGTRRTVGLELVREDGTALAVKLESLVVSGEDGDSKRIRTAILDMSELARVEALLERSKEEFRIIAEKSRDMILRFTPSGEITFCSPTLKTVLGYSPDDLVGGKISKYLSGRESADFDEFLRRANLGEAVGILEVNLLSRDGRRIPFEVNLSPVVESGEIKTILAIARNSERRRASEKNLLLINRLLTVANRHSDMRGLLTGFLEEIWQLSGCDAIGIRLLEEGGRIPYQAYKGFSKEFYNMESPLSLKSDRCMCINVIKGIYDPKLPFFTKNGSFWINGTTRFLATVSEKEKGETRNRCNREGYESVALIPIRAGNQIMGLIHLADHTEDKFTGSLVEGLEGAGLHLGVALKRVLAEEKVLQMKSELERRVEERTDKLSRSNALLRQEIKERQSAEKRALASEKKFSRMVENSLSGIFLIQRGRIVFANDRFASIYGYSKEELVGLDPMKLLHPESRALVREIFTRKLRGEETLPVYDVKGLKRNGEAVWTTGKIDVSKYEGKKAIMGHVFDITERKQACEGLVASRKKLRTLSNRVLGAYEEERKRIARELHDVLGQNLSAIKFSVEKTLQLIHRNGLQNGFKALENVVPLVQESVNEVRRISKNLRPDVLDDLGILSTIRWFGREFEKIYPETRIQSCLEIDEGRVPAPLKIVIYRVIQEALHNVAKHSGASLAKVSLKETEGRMQLVVEDNGSGFQVASVLASENPDRGLGLMSMKERLELSGGGFSVESREGGGTVVRASWALDRGSWG